MSNEGFKHITVTAPEEDDVVIVAGASRETEVAPGIGGGSEDSVVAPPVLDELPVTGSPVGTHDNASAAEGGAENASKARQSSLRDDGYRETTLEDLEDRSMPFAQKAVIIAAIALIVVAIVYCAFFL